MTNRRTTIAAVAITATLTTIGTALAASDAFDCNGCIDKGDIGAAAVGGSELVDGSVTAADIGAGAVRASEIATGAVGGAELANGLETRLGNPMKVASWSETIAPSATRQFFDAGHLAVTPPASGYLLVQTAARYNCPANAWNQAAFGLHVATDATTPTSASAFADEVTIGYAYDRADIGNGGVTRTPTSSSRHSRSSGARPTTCGSGSMASTSRPAAAPGTRA